MWFWIIYALLLPTLLILSTFCVRRLLISIPVFATHCISSPCSHDYRHDTFCQCSVDSAPVVTVVILCACRCHGCSIICALTIVALRRWVHRVLACVTVAVILPCAFILKRLPLPFHAFGTHSMDEFPYWRVLTFCYWLYRVILPCAVIQRYYLRCCWCLLFLIPSFAGRYLRCRVSFACIKLIAYVACVRLYARWSTVLCVLLCGLSTGTPNVDSFRVFCIPWPWMLFWIQQILRCRFGLTFATAPWPTSSSPCPAFATWPSPDYALDYVAATFAFRSPAMRLPLWLLFVYTTRSVCVFVLCACVSRLDIDYYWINASIRLDPALTLLMRRDTALHELLFTIFLWYGICIY